MSVFRQVFLTLAVSANQWALDTATVLTPRRKSLLYYLLDLMSRSLRDTVLRCALLFPDLDNQVRFAITQSFTQGVVNTDSSRDFWSVSIPAHYGSTVASSLGLSTTTWSPWSGALKTWMNSMKQLNFDAMVRQLVSFFMVALCRTFA